MFSPWRYNIDPATARLLAPTGWQAPDPEAYPTGGELVGALPGAAGARCRSVAPHLRLARASSA